VASGFAILTIIACTSAFAYTGEKYATHDNLSMHKTIGIALNARPGKVVSKESWSMNGEGSSLRYSSDIKSHAVTYEVGGDAKSGKILENGREGPNAD